MRCPPGTDWLDCDPCTSKEDGKCDTVSENTRYWNLRFKNMRKFVGENHVVIYNQPFPPVDFQWLSVAGSRRSGTGLYALMAQISSTVSLSWWVVSLLLVD